ncbi:MAG TPA: hypothetical protein VLL52_22375 [Anaerolineae bacterium]|nr:hypothetical protein [Anaerolineae bacterium]
MNVPITFFNPQLPQELDNLITLAFQLQQNPQGLDFIRTILYYLTKATGKVKPTGLRQALLKQGQLGEQAMKTIAEQWIEEGMQKGLSQGFEKGLEKGREEGQEEALQQVGWRLLNTFEVAQVSELMGVPLDKVLAWQKELNQKRASDQAD